MSDQQKRKWIIKTADGHIKGPFFTDEILKKIRAEELTGDEMISLFPLTEWSAISSHAEFYDLLLDILERDSLEPAESAGTGAHSRIKQSASYAKPDSLSASSSSAKDESDSVKSKAEKITEKASSPRPSSEGTGDQPVIELKKRKTRVKEKKIKQSILPFLVGTSAIAAVTLWILTDVTQTEPRVRLLAPQKNIKAEGAEAANAKIRSGLNAFQKDTLSGYLFSQNEFIAGYQSDYRAVASLGFLCLTYYQLWPFSYQDSEDLLAMTTTVQLAAQSDPAGAEAATCRAIDLLVRGRILEAKSIIETALETHAQAAPATFYYLKTLLQMATKEYESALNYARSAQQSWPEWLELFQQEAVALNQLGRFDEAAKRFRQIVSANKEHVEAELELAILEYRFFKNIENAENLARRALAQEDQAHRGLVARAYLALAEIALQKGQQREALKMAQKAYSLNARDARAREIIVSIGGESQLKETKVQDRQLVYEGDQLVREGDCSAAQAYYKAAFVAQPRNAMAAMKAAECLWKMSLTVEAIDWLNRAIRADPQLVDAYVMLADFYSRIFNFQAAAQILAKANQVVPRNYKVFRGFALMELRRRNPEGAAQSVEQALRLYEADVESYIISARAYIELKQFSKAFTAASKAVELDVNNRNAQIAYAESLVGVQGMNMAVQYMNRLVSFYPHVLDYRMALGDLYMKDQSYDSAEALYEQVVRLDNRRREAHLKLGQVRRSLRKYDSAIDAFLKAAELDPSDVEPLVQLGLLYMELRKPAESQTQFIRAQRINSEYPLIHFYIGRAAFLNGAYEQALEEARKEKVKNPNLADPYLLAADVYVEMQKYQLCAAEYQQAVRLRPQGSDIYVKMARCFRLAGNLDAATSMINTAAQQESANPEIYKEQAQIFETRGEKIKAIEAYNQYLVLAPNAADRDTVADRIRRLSQ